MVLSSDLIKQFAKSTKDETKKTTEATVYGTVIQQSSGTHVRLDGTELLTPVETTAEISNGERVAVLLRNHTAMVMGNVSNPSASTRTVSGIRADVDNNGNKIEAMNNTVTAIGNQVTAQGNNITLINNTIVSQGNTIVAQGNKIEVINSTVNAHGSQISTMNDTIVSQGNNIELLDNTITAQGNDIKIYNSSFQITNGVVTGIKGINTDWITVGSLEAGFADIENLKADKLSVTDANIKYANIEFTNIGKAAMENFYAKSGLIKNVVVGDQTITGELVGVTIRGDLIEGNTIVADKLVVKGANGLYYKLNTDGVTTEAEQTDYNSLSGTIIRAKSVTAEKIAVEDLVAFGATIGGFNITENSIYSGVKETVNNGTRGIYLDNTGQIGFGDSVNYVKFYKDQNGNYKLAISAESMVLSSSSTNVADAIDRAQSKADAAVIKTIEEFYLSSSPTTLSDGSWSPAQPVWRDGMYIWRRNKVTYGSGLIEYTPSEIGVCITGNTGAQGIQGLQGEKGDQGIQGPKGDTGAQGNTSYFHIKYSDVENPTSSSDMKETPSTYIGTYVDYTSTDSTNPSAYTWARFQGIQGPKGDQGIPGIGTDGKTSYLHIAYANSQDGSSGFSVSDSVGKLYIGQYTDFTSTDSTDYKKYSWTKIKGDTGSAGNGVASTEVTYQAGSSGTTAPTGTWYSSPPQTSASAPYMWTRTRLTYTNGSSSVSYSVGSTPEGIEVGGRNLWINSSKYRESTPYLITASGTDNWVFSFDGKFIYSTEPFKAGDIITVQGKSNLPWAKTHGGSSTNNGTVGYWLYFGTLDQVKSGNYTSPGFISFDGVNTVFKKTITIPSISGLNTIYIGFRFNSYSYNNVSITAKFWDIKLEKGNKATDWSPAPEDVDSSISAVNTIATKTADKFNWLVKSGTSSTDFTLTDRTATLVANAINLQGLVTFDGLSSAAQSKITTAQSTADSAKTAAANAQATANSASSAAGTAQSTADTARNEIASLGKITVKRYDIGGASGSAKWFKLGTLVSNGDSSNTVITVYSGNGFNGTENQNSQAEIVIKDGWQSSQSATTSFGVSVTRQNCENLRVKVMASSHNTCDVWVYFPWDYWSGMYTIVGNYSSWTHSGTYQDSEPSSGVSQSVGYRANAENALASADLANTTLANWCYNNDKTYINGGKIYTGTIAAEKLSVTSLSSISANLGSITAGSINIGSGKFVVTSAGALTATGATITGNITATSGSFTGTVNANEGTIGNIKISGNKISYDSIDSSYGTLAKFEISKSQLSYGCMIVKGNSMQIGRDQRNQTFIDGNDTTRIYGDFLFQDYSNTMRRPVASVSGDGSKVSHISSSVSNGVKIAAQWNVAGASLSIKTFTASSSDIRLKENIRPTEVNALSVINQMGLYQFDWKRDGYHQKIGFVADYLEQQDEHLAIGGGYDEDGNMDEKVVNDFYLMGYAIKGIQELDAKVDTATKSLESRINSLQYQLQQAFDKIAKQEKQINLLTQ